MPLKPALPEDKSEPRDQNLSIRISVKTLEKLKTLCKFSGKSTGAVIDEAINTEYEYQRKNERDALNKAELLSNNKSRKAKG